MNELNEIQPLNIELSDMKICSYQKTLDYWFISQKIKTLKKLLEEQNGRELSLNSFWPNKI